VELNESGGAGEWGRGRLLRCARKESGRAGEWGSGGRIKLFCGEKRNVRFTVPESWFLVPGSWFLLPDSFSVRFVQSLI